MSRNTDIGNDRRLGFLKNIHEILKGRRQKFGCECSRFLFSKGLAKWRSYSLPDSAAPGIILHFPFFPENSLLIEKTVQAQ